MMMFSNVSFLMVLFAVDVAFSAEGFFDYEGETENKNNFDNIHDLYNLLWRRNMMDKAAQNPVPFEHLMIRKSQRSPSLRLRFGRSGPAMSTGFLTRPIAKPDAFDDN